MTDAPATFRQLVKAMRDAQKAYYRFTLAQTLVLAKAYGGEGYLASLIERCPLPEEDDDG